MAKTQQPPVNQTSQGAIKCNGIMFNPALEMWMFGVPGALTNGAAGDGAGWAGIGSIAVRGDTGKMYTNTNTKASPTWTEVSNA